MQVKICHVHVINVITLAYLKQKRFVLDFRKDRLNLIFNNINYYSEYNCISIFIFGQITFNELVTFIYKFSIYNIKYFLLTSWKSMNS